MASSLPRQRNPGQSDSADEDLAKGMHPAAAILVRPAAMVAHSVKLIEAAQLDLELQRGSAFRASAASAFGH